MYSQPKRASAIVEKGGRVLHYYEVFDNTARWSSTITGKCKQDQNKFFSQNFDIGSFRRQSLVKILSNIKLKVISMTSVQ